MTNTTEETTEKQHNWHALPGMIGVAITEGHSPIVCGGYLVERDANGGVHIYRVADKGESRDQLTKTADEVFDFTDFAVAGEHVGAIPAPDGGWDDEITQVGETIWGGWD